jgi:hypothetical protein
MRRSLHVCAAALLVALAASCGIDSQHQEDQGGGTSGPPDISGTWEGAFTSVVDDGVHTITSLLIVQVASNTFQLEFEVASETPDGDPDPEGLFLDTELNKQVNQTGINADDMIFLSAQDGDLLLNGTVSRNGSQIEGDWLQSKPTEDHGSWSVTRTSR